MAHKTSARSACTCNRHSSWRKRRSLSVIFQKSACRTRNNGYFFGSHSWRSYCNCNPRRSSNANRSGQNNEVYFTNKPLCLLGALGAGFFVTALAFSKAGKASSVMLLLCGTALGTLWSAISSAILLTSNKELHSIYTWILGSFNGRGWKELIFIAIPSAISVVIMLSISRPLDLLTCGEKTASTLGVEVDRLRILVLTCGALAVSAAVCAGGTIGFVGLIAPHIVRKLSGARGKTLIPLSMCFGASLLLLSDTIARTAIAPGELPAGIITSILGVPFFLSLCLTRKNS